MANNSTASFVANIKAQLDLSGIDAQLQKIGNKQINLKNVKISNFTLDTSNLKQRLQATLDNHKFTIHVGNISTSPSVKSAFTSGIEKQLQTGAIESSIAKVTAQYEKLATTGHGKLQIIQNDIKELNKLHATMASTTDSYKLTATYEQFNQTLAKVRNSLMTVSADAKTFVSSAEINALDAQMETWLRNNTAAAKDFGGRIKELQEKLSTLSNSTGVTRSSLNSLKQSFNEVTVSATIAGKTGKSFGVTMQAAIERASKFISASTIFYQCARALREMYSNVVDVDTAMTELYRVTSLTTTEYEELYDTMTESAKEYGSTLTDIINSTASWVRLGFDSDTAEELSEITAMYQHVTDLDYDTAVDNLVTAYKAFSDQLDEMYDGDVTDSVTYIADVFDKLGKFIALNKLYRLKTKG